MGPHVIVIPCHSQFPPRPTLFFLYPFLVVALKSQYYYFILVFIQIRRGNDVHIPSSEDPWPNLSCKRSNWSSNIWALKNKLWKSVWFLQRGACTIVDLSCRRWWLSSIFWVLKKNSLKIVWLLEKWFICSYQYLKISSLGVPNAWHLTMYCWCLSTHYLIVSLSFYLKFWIWVIAVCFIPI